MGRPLITSRIHGCVEAVKEGESGYLVDVQDAKGLEEKIKEFIKLPYNEKKKMGEVSRKVMEGTFDKKDVVRMTVRELSK